MKKSVIFALPLLAMLTSTSFALEPAVAAQSNLPVTLTDKPSVALAAQNIPISMEQANILVKKVTNNLVDVLSMFPGPEGMTGVIMTSPNGKGVGWISPEGRHLLLGAMVNSEGKNLSIEAHDKYIGNEPTAAPKHGKELLSDLDALTYVLLGKKGGAPVYVFSDMRCRYCENLYKTLARESLAPEKRGIEIHWIPVGILGPESVKQAANLLMSPALSQPDILRKHYSGEALSSEIKDAEAGRQALADVAKNTAIFTTLGSGTPTLVYWNGEDTQVVAGLPTEEEISRIFTGAKHPGSGNNAPTRVPVAP